MQNANGSKKTCKVKFDADSRTEDHFRGDIIPCRAEFKRYSLILRKRLLTEDKITVINTKDSEIQTNACQNAGLEHR